MIKKGNSEMAYSQAFFAFQIEIAQILARRFDLDIIDALFYYTTLTKTAFDSGSWEEYTAGLPASDDIAAYTYVWYLTHKAPEVTPETAYFLERPLFGCFYYTVRDTTVIRPHFLKNDAVGSPLSRARMGNRLAELCAMFAHIRQHVPEATVVRGNSWLYNLEAYRRLYPPVYTALLPESAEDEFQFLARWGQLFDRRWAVREPEGDRFRERVAALADISDLRHCFPYQILQPRSPITSFYSFYKVE
jgi:hypothetical protein